MTEEIKRIDESKQAEFKRKSLMSNDLTGEQIFFRSCNTCHPGGKKNVGPSLEQMDDHFPDDAKLIAFLRKGKGIMPPQTKDVLNDNEMLSLVSYLRQLNQ
jgi:cytochrome c2